MALAAALADPGKDRDTLVALGHRMDQLHDEHGLADAGAAEHRRLAALGDRGQQIDDLDAGRKQLGGAAQLLQRRRTAVDRPARSVRRQRLALVANSAGQVEQTAEHRVADRNLERPASGARRNAATQPFGRLQCNRADRRLVQMRLHFRHDRRTLIRRHDQRVVDRRQRRGGKSNVEHGAAHGDDPTVSDSRLCHTLLST